MCLAAALSLGVGLLLAGCDMLFNIPEVTVPPPPSQGLDNGYTCECTCTYSGTGQSSDLPLKVCVPAALNPNLMNGTTPMPADLLADCGKTANSRVVFEVQKMSNKCYPKTTCTCTTAMPLPDTFWDASCDQGCVADQLDATCSNWNPGMGIKQANCASASACTSPGPVCLRQQSDPPVPAPSPLAAGIMGHLSRCRVNGQLTVTAAGQAPTSPVTGVVNFAPAPPGSCSAGGTCLTMDYRLDTTQTIHFDGIGFLGIGDTNFENIVTLGASTPFAIGASGLSFLDAATTQTSGRGFQDGSLRARFGTNTDRIVVGFDGSACTIQGDLVGGVGDPNGNNAGFDVAVRVFGVVENTPPQASLGADRQVECTSPTGADVVLDATSSTDREANIVGFGWFLGTRAGDYLGSTPTITVHQPLGAQTYFVKAVDAFMQADEASATITVADTTAPTIACNAPATITPSKTPYAFTATATDTCDAALGAPAIVGFDCFALNGSGKPVARDCQVKVSGSTFTIIDSGGIGDHFRWRERVTDAHGNTNLTTCETLVVRRKQ